MTAAIVFDSSAVIAFIRREPGYRAVIPHLGNAAISTVNLQEVLKVLLLGGLGIQLASDLLAELRLDVRVHDQDDALQAAQLIHATRQYGSGLGDRSCMALAIRLGVPALTTDHAWTRLEIPGLTVVLAR
jgi:PIN domain nuclease of toxin-antitoxin system